MIFITEGTLDSGLSQLGDNDTIEGVLQNFGNSLQEELRASLNDKGMQVSDKLGSSIIFDIDPSDGRLKFELKMEQYGSFLDEGVTGVGEQSIKAKDHASYPLRQTTGRFSFKDTKEGRPSVKHFIDWANNVGANAFAARESVFRRGIAQTNWYSEVIEGKVEELKGRLEKAGAKEITLSFKNGILKGQANG